MYQGYLPLFDDLATMWSKIHTHMFNGRPLSGTTQVSWYQNGKTNLDFTEARDTEWQWHQLGQSAPCSRQITTPAPHHSVFFTDRMPVTRPTVSKHIIQKICYGLDAALATPVFTLNPNQKLRYATLLEAWPLTPKSVCLLSFLQNMVRPLTCSPA